jgi:hypothetical protein
MDDFDRAEMDATRTVVKAAFWHRGSGTEQELFDALAPRAAGGWR